MNSLIYGLIHPVSRRKRVPKKVCACACACANCCVMNDYMIIL